MGEADDAVAGDREPGVLGAIAFEGAVGQVGAAAVGLDDHALVGPEEVDLVVSDQVVDERSREAVRVAEREEAGFELRARELVVAVEVEHRGEGSASAVGAVQVEGGLDGGEIEELEDLRPLDGARQAVWLQERRGVQQGAGDGRDPGSPRGS